jgi:hypothetical protein
MRFTALAILVLSALLAGATAGAIAKFGLGYDIETNGRQARSI